MSQTLSPVSGRPYGLASVCRVWRLARAGVYRHLAPAPAASPRRPGPTGTMTDAALTVAIRDILAASPFTARAIARSGHDCVTPEPAHRYGACSA
jgi:putative transposase